MTDEGFPKPVESVLATLRDIYRHQGDGEIVEVLESASARFELTDYDNWNGGTSTYGLMLEIPVTLFAGVEAKLEALEKGICSKLQTLCRDLTHDHVGSVTITPVASKSASIGPVPRPPEADVKHLWRDGYLRLFMSHASRHKEDVIKLKAELQQRGVSAFVAHEDIKPSFHWQSEIELALRSMHALTALLTDDFHASQWTDQEVGFALGKGVLVLPVRLASDPYGFIGKVQGLSGSLAKPRELANLITKTLLEHPSTRRPMRKGIVSAFAAAESYVMAISLSKIIETIEDFSKDEKSLIQTACKDNGQVFNATGVVSRVCKAIGVPEPKQGEPAEDDVPF